MANYPIPPWLSQPADPAAHYVTGLQIGVRIGAQQASQQFAQQQYLREMQKDEFDRQYKTQARQMEIDEITRKHRAIANYQDMINQGVDPMTALRQAGPDMGVTPDRIEQIDAMRQYRMEQQKATEAYRTGELELGRENLELRKDALRQAAEKEARMAGQAADREKRIAAQSQQRMKQSLTGIISRDSTLKQLQTELESAQRLVADLDAEKPGWFSRTKAEIATEKRNTMQDIQDLQRKIAARKSELQGQFSEVATAAGSEAAPEPGDSAGDNTMPDQPAEPATQDQWKMIGGFKVRVK